MAQWYKVLLAVGFSVSATLLGMLVMSQFPGMDIDPAFWVFGALCPAVISAPVSVILVRQIESNRVLNQQLVVTQEKLQAQADHDHLTGVLNRAAFYREASRSISEHPSCVLLADIDHFKAINDNHGHAAGDMALCVVARTLAHATRDCDFIGRIGGEEFAIFLSDVPVSLGMTIAERARVAVAGLELLTDDGAILDLTISIGVSPVSPDGSLERALAQADAAMYDAKRNGRNKVLLAA